MACDFDLAVLGDWTSLEAFGWVSHVESCVLGETCMVWIDLTVSKSSTDKKSERQGEAVSYSNMWLKS